GAQHTARRLQSLRLPAASFLPSAGNSPDMCAAQATSSLPGHGQTRSEFVGQTPTRDRGFV
ncbi:MAG TPA: hypothetical protein VHI52_20865, partial [Verrucomicrobiae bacterium]|nr:hypothetical protein [Verrucomicrobiae bacterium]